MAGLLSNFRNTVIVSVILALIMLAAYAAHSPGGLDTIFWQGTFRLLHVFAGILWIGLLYYFNFVQIRKMPEIPAELKPGVSKYIAPEALFWFRWAAVATVISGLAIAETGGMAVGERYLVPGLTFQQGYRVIGLGMWLGLIMAANVWFIIWPNQQKALGLKPADDATKARAARVAMLASRTNLVLSIPMLYAMVTQIYLPE